ncbi:MAG TPA: PEP-CTERM sorting domain-containing protein [Bryobacteraceae bacterium]|jgi:MYXO-CTERM domain-containing protein|nr:PEP-CTERM sorting domain-containing protein [Bryobacteraceae bacterium]
MRACLLFLCAVPALGSVFTSIPQPTAGYLSSTTLLAIADPEGSIVGSVSDGFLTVSFQSGGSSALMDVDAVPDSWSTWGAPPDTESATPAVLAFDDPTATAMSFLFDRQLVTFGVEIEPDDTSPGNQHDVTATYWLGSTLVGTIDRSVSGDGGALLFAGSGGPFDRVDVASDIDFASAQFRYTPTPEPAAFWLAGAGLLAIVRRRRAN